MVVADSEGNETFCKEYQLTCKGIEEDLFEEEIQSGILTLIDSRPKGKVRKKAKRKFKGRGQNNYLLKSKRDKKLETLEKTSL